MQGYEDSEFVFYAAGDDFRFCGHEGAGHPGEEAGQPEWNLADVLLLFTVAGNLVMTSAGAVIIGYGTFSLSSSTFYTEYVEENVHLPQLKGSENKLYFELKEGGKLMSVKYFVETDAEGNRIDAWCKEMWRRVEVAPAYPGDDFR